MYFWMVKNERKNHTYKVISIMAVDGKKIESEIATTKYKGNATLIAKMFDETVFATFENKPIIEIR